MSTNEDPLFLEVELDSKSELMLFAKYPELRVTPVVHMTIDCVEPSRIQMYESILDLAIETGALKVPPVRRMVIAHYLTLVWFMKPVGQREYIAMSVREDRSRPVRNLLTFALRLRAGWEKQADGN